MIIALRKHRFILRCESGLVLYVYAKVYNTRTKFISIHVFFFVVLKYGDVMATVPLQAVTAHIQNSILYSGKVI